MHRYKLIAKARKVAENSYSPYSNFPVGAAVLCESGKIYTGCNVENASYGLTICAERSAIFNAISNGERKIIEIAVTCIKLIGTKERIDPSYLISCGACRQVLSEFMSKHGLIHIDGDMTYRLEEIFPHPFQL